MRDDDRQCVRVSRTDVNEVNVHAVDPDHELGIRAQRRLGRSPVVVRSPVTDEALESLERHALRLIGHGLLAGPAGRRKTTLQVGEVAVRYVDVERTNRRVGAFGRRGVRLLYESRHAVLLERMTPDLRREIYQTKVLAMPSYW